MVSNSIFNFFIKVTGFNLIKKTLSLKKILKTNYFFFKKIKLISVNWFNDGIRHEKKLRQICLCNIKFIYRKLSDKT